MKKFKNILIVLLIPVIYALVIRLMFGLDKDMDLLEVMSISFLFFLPTIVGILSVYFSKEESVKSYSFRLFFPWIPVLLFFVITIIFSIEGWACWIMVLPLFFMASSIGGLLGGYFKTKNSKNKLKLSFILFLPLIFSPLENLIEKIPSKYEAYTYIDIDAPADVIWDNVTRVKNIDKKDDTAWLTNFLGFPRPLKAELNYEGVGAYRKAIFSGGLVFHETVTEYVDNKKMVFNIDVNPAEIPSTTLDEHVLIGGDYFDVLNGTYELEKLNSKTNRLHLTSFFEMKTTFNFYAGWWGKLIMKDIQNNILRVHKKRSEK